MWYASGVFLGHPKSNLSRSRWRTVLAPHPRAWSWAALLVRLALSLSPPSLSTTPPGPMTVLRSGALAAASPFTVRRIDKECHTLAKTTAYQIRQTSVQAESSRQTRTSHPSKRGKQQVSFPMTPLMMMTTRLPSTGAHVNVPTQRPHTFHLLIAIETRRIYQAA
jgi:hypothetical protein